MGPRVGRKPRIAIALLATALLASAAGADDDPFKAADRSFVTIYDRNAALSARVAPPAILVLPGRLVLHHGGQRIDAPVDPAGFDSLKTVAHMPLGVFAVATLPDGAPLDRARRDELARLRAWCTELRAALAHSDLSEAQQTRQRRILDETVAFIQRIERDGKIQTQDLQAFTRSMTPLLDANVREAVVSYLDALNVGVKKLLPHVAPDARDDLLVIVSGVHQARIDNSAVQYFRRLLGDPPPIDQRILYAENVFDEAGALRLLGVHQMERRVGAAFWDDPDHMNRDLLSYAAREYVPTMSLPDLAPAER